jgi:hypothetical protein
VNSYQLLRSTVCLSMPQRVAASSAKLAWSSFPVRFHTGPLDSLRCIHEWQHNRSARAARRAPARSGRGLLAVRGYWSYFFTGFAQRSGCPMLGIHTEKGWFITRLHRRSGLRQLCSQACILVALVTCAVLSHYHHQPTCVAHPCGAVTLTSESDKPGPAQASRKSKAKIGMMKRPRASSARSSTR